ncbi:MAG: phosphoribosylanthranilate isomerase, partial [Anderseniella sp.]
SPRNVSIEVARTISRYARGRSKIVALVVDADDKLIDAINAGLQPDYFQVHGSETPQRIAAIKARTGVPVIKAIKIRDAHDIEMARGYNDTADMILFDAKAPEDLVNALPGGNGLAFDWSLLSANRSQKNYMLSGGLNLDNVARAIDITSAPIVDVSSGVESRPGVKDAAAIMKFIETVRQHG